MNSFWFGANCFACGFCLPIIISDGLLLGIDMTTVIVGIGAGITGALAFRMYIDGVWRVWYE